MHAHLYSVVLEKNLQPPMPAVGLVCSGGHTALYEINNWLEVKLIGSTIDDAVGEAYDKVAAILGLGYPGGPILDRLAATGNPTAIRFPRTLLDRDSLDFSFSGLKTAVLYHVRGVPKRGQDVKTETNPPMNEPELADIAASFQAACIDVITEKLNRAARRTRRPLRPHRRRRLRQPRAAQRGSLNFIFRSTSRPSLLHRQRRHVRRPGGRLPLPAPIQSPQPRRDHV